MDQQESTLTAEQLTRMLDAEKQQRRDLAISAIRAALVEYRCTVQGVPLFVPTSGGGYHVTVDFQVIAL